MKWLYKLTDQQGKTRAGSKNELTWGPGVRHSVPMGERAVKPSKPQLCTSNVIHCYENPLVAVFMNTKHANIKNPRLWKASGFVVAREGQLKAGCITLTTLEEIELPVITTAQRIRTAIYCAQTHECPNKWTLWAQRWLANVDRTADAAYATAAAHDAAAAHAAYAATQAAASQTAASQAIAASYAAHAAADASASASVAYAANLNLIKLLKKAIKDEVAV